MARYTILVKANVQNANAFQGYFVGMSTPNTAISFAEHIKLGILKSIKESNFDGFDSYDPQEPSNSFEYINVEDIIYGFDGVSFDLHGGHEKFVSAMKGNYDINPPIIDNKTFSSDFFITFTLDFKRNISNFDKNILKDIIYNLVNMSKFSGGKIFNAFKDNIEVVSQREIKDDFSDIAGLLKNKLKRGHAAWFLVEQFSDIYLNAFNNVEEYVELSDIDKILYIVKRAKWTTRKNKVATEYDHILDGYYVPMTIGYRFLDNLSEPRSRFKFKYAYSEPLLGVVRCRSLDSFLNDPIHEVVWNNELHSDLILSIAKSIN